MNKNMQELLYRSFDDELSDSEKKQLNKELAQDPELQEEKASLEEMRSRITKSSSTSFSSNFADKVMDQLSPQKMPVIKSTLSESIYTLFRPLAIAASIIILVMVSFNIYKSRDISWESALVVPEISLEDAYDPVVALHWEK